jgi:hypothetical protein
VNTLSEISRWEIEKFGYTEWSFLKECHELLDQPGVEMETGFDREDRPIVIFGTVPHAQDPVVRVIYLIAAQRFFDLGAPMVRFARRYVRKVVDQRPGFRFDAYTASPHPQVDRWLHLLGFSGPIEEGGARLFEMYGKRRDAAKTKC